MDKTGFAQPLPPENLIPNINTGQKTKVTVVRMFNPAPPNESPSLFIPKGRETIAQYEDRGYKSASQDYKSQLAKGVEVILSLSDRPPIIGDHIKAAASKMLPPAPISELIPGLQGTFKATLSSGGRFGPQRGSVSNITLSVHSRQVVFDGKTSYEPLLRTHPASRSDPMEFTSKYRFILAGEVKNQMAADALMSEMLSANSDARPMKLERAFAVTIIQENARIEHHRQGNIAFSAALIREDKTPYTDYHGTTPVLKVTRDPFSPKQAPDADLQGELKTSDIWSLLHTDTRDKHESIRGRDRDGPTRGSAELEDCEWMLTKHPSKFSIKTQMTNILGRLIFRYVARGRGQNATRLSAMETRRVNSSIFAAIESIITPGISFNGIVRRPILDTTNLTGFSEDAAILRLLIGRLFRVEIGGKVLHPLSSTQLQATKIPLSFIRDGVVVYEVDTFIVRMVKASGISPYAGSNFIEMYNAMRGGTIAGTNTNNKVLGISRQSPIEVSDSAFLPIVSHTIIAPNGAELCFDNIIRDMAVILHNAIVNQTTLMRSCVVWHPLVCIVVSRDKGPTESYTAFLMDGARQSRIIPNMANKGEALKSDAEGRVEETIYSRSRGLGYIKSLLDFLVKK
jgi:hypothetical protein